MKLLLVLILALITQTCFSSDFDDAIKSINQNDFKGAIEAASGFSDYMTDDFGKTEQRAKVQEWIKDIKNSIDYCKATDSEIIENISSGKLSGSCVILSYDKPNFNELLTPCLNEKNTFEENLKEFQELCSSNRSRFQTSISLLQKHSAIKINIGQDNYSATTEKANSVVSKIDSEIKQVKEKYAAIDKKAEDEKRPEKERMSSIGMICQLQRMNDIGRKEIEKEKKAGKISGFVNASKLQELGTMIVNNEEHIENYKEKLLKNNKYKFKSSDCK